MRLFCRNYLNYFIVLLGMFALLSCKGQRNTVVGTVEDNMADIENEEGVTIFVKALDLGEDKSDLSTKDDEIILLIYAVVDDFEINEPLVQITHRFTPENRESRFGWPNAKDYEGKKIMVVLIEQDSDKGIEQIDPIVRVYADQMIQALAVRQYLEIEKYLEDDDLLGIKVIDNFDLGSSKGVSFSGVYLFDHYEYQIKFETEN